MSLSGDVMYANAPADWTKLERLGGQEISITSAAGAALLDITQVLRDPADFHGSTLVHDVVQFGGALTPLIGDHAGKTEMFTEQTKEERAASGIIVLSDYVYQAGDVVEEISALAKELIADPEKYNDPEFCRSYFDLAREGYDLLTRYVPSITAASVPNNTVPVSLVRAGLTATRMARELRADAAISNEIRVVTKRAHPIGGAHTDLMVTVKWEDFADIRKLHGANVEIADFVNPASGASSAALLLAAKNRGAIPESVIHRSIVGTTQGIEFWHKALSAAGIRPYFIVLGTSADLNDDYYLQNPAVADAGHALRHFLPKWYTQK